MILKDLKNSMLFKACEYSKQKVGMDKFISVNTTAMIQPEEDVIRFYLGAHVLGAVESKYGVETELPEAVAELVKAHHSHMEDVFFRIFTYILLISVGESRHGKVHSQSATILKQYGADVKNFGSVTNGKKNRSGSRDEFLSCDRDLLDFSRYCDWMFVHCFAGMGSYGGKKWKNISQKITHVLEGEISPFTMVDVAWALVHNTGSIFNKNTIYKHELDGAGLTQLLDMQRGGAIPSLIKHFEKYKSECPSFRVASNVAANFVGEVNSAASILGEEFYSYVSPAAIHEAGALSKHVFKKAKDAVDATKDSDSDEEFFPSGNLDLMIMKIPTLTRKGVKHD